MVQRKTLDQITFNVPNLLQFFNFTFHFLLQVISANNGNKSFTKSFINSQWSHSVKPKKQFHSEQSYSHTVDLH